MQALAGTAIVLGGGGVAGVAWMTGIMAGLHRRGFRIPPDCLLVGTSAGSVVSAELAHGVSAETLVARQFQEADEMFRPYSQREANTRGRALMKKVGGDRSMARKRVGEFALASRTPSLDTRRGIIRSRLTHAEWPLRPLRLVAMDAITGDAMVLDREGGLDLVDAVMASCAVPGVWPAVPSGERWLVDGGLRSLNNADLASGKARVLVLAPLGYADDNPVCGHLRAEVDGLREAGASVQVIVPDGSSADAIGDNVLDPGRRAASAEAGLAQGLREYGMPEAG